MVTLMSHEIVWVLLVGRLRGQTSAPYGLYVCMEASIQDGFMAHDTQAIRAIGVIIVVG